MLPKLIKRLKGNVWRQWLIYLFITGGLTSVIASFILQKFFQDNQPPIPDIAVSSYVGTAPHTVMFDATSSLDPEGKTLNYRWRIDDKIVAMQPYFTFTFNETGENRVELAITDPVGRVATTSVFITTNPPAQVRTVTEALKYRDYKIGWLNKDTGIMEYYALQRIKVDDKFIHMLYAYKNGQIYALAYDFNRELVGILQDDDGENIFDLVFDQDFSTANGWWRYDHKSKKFKLIITRDFEKH